jgi:hypothetical protein
MRCRLATWLLALSLVAAADGRAQPVAPDEVPLADLLEILLLDRELIAIDARGGGQLVERLQLDETVLWLGSHGQVGVAVTTRRVLAAATGSAAWQEASYQQNERPPHAPLLGDRVALAVTNRRALGFDGGSGNLVEYRLGPNERALTSRAGENVGVIVTDRSALGLSPLAGGFFRAKLGVAERIESLSTGANVATLTTDRRVLIFRATTGTWEERARNLR